MERYKIPSTPLRQSTHSGMKYNVCWNAASRQSDRKESTQSRLYTWTCCEKKREHSIKQFGGHSSVSAALEGANKYLTVGGETFGGGPNFSFFHSAERTIDWLSDNAEIYPGENLYKGGKSVLETRVRKGSGDEQSNFWSG